MENRVLRLGFLLQMSVPLNLSDPWLAEWSQPVTIVRSTQGPQPHSWVRA